MIFDDLLQEFIDDNGKIVKGTPTVEKHSFGGEYKAIRIIKKKTEEQENENNKY